MAIVPTPPFIGNKNKEIWKIVLTNIIKRNIYKFIKIQDLTNFQ